MPRGLKLVFLGLWIGQIPLILSAQEKYWVHKNDTSAISSQGLVYCSQWLPYCTYLLDDEDKVELQDPGKLMPVRSYRPSQRHGSVAYGFALEQIEADKLIAKGLTGKEVKIGIIDGGFLKADQDPVLKSHFREQRVISYKDYITPDMPHYEGSKHLDDEHGADVWALIGGYNETTKVISGIATDAEYYLARTDHGAFEKRLEEDLLIRALEDMYSQGVRLINISLGYADGYTRKDQNYQPEQMDGVTSLLAQAVDTAFYKKNMLVIVSAGNEGNRQSWKVLSTPGDSKGALTVGASMLDGRRRMKYSSIGTPGIGYVKPEVVCFASNGTSFSAPVITGLAAAIMQYDTTLLAAEIKELIIKSSSLYPFGNNHLGFGVPNAANLLELLEGREPEKETVLHHTKKRTVLIKTLEAKKMVTIFHKNSDEEVIENDSKKPSRNRMRIRRVEGAVQTSVLGDNEYHEIFWKE
jgi:subtilisin family serine protease